MSKPGQPNVYRYGALVSDNYGTPEYAAQLVGQNVTNVTLSPEQSATFQVVIKNIGTATWSSGGQNPVRLGTDNPQNRVSPFCTSNNGWFPSGCSRITMTPVTVAPGQNATFTAPLRVPTNLAAGTYVENFKPLVEDKIWFDNIPIAVSINVTRDYAAQFTSQSHSTLTLGRGGTAMLVLTEKNIGTKTWYAADPTSTRLGTANPFDHASQFSAGTPNWMSSTRIRMNETSVAPGQSATFNIPLKIPVNLQDGTYTESFQMLVEGLTWFGGAVTVTINVSGKSEYSAQFVSQNFTRVTLSPGQFANFQVVLKNTGTAPWYSTNQGGIPPMLLGTQNPENHPSPFCTNNNGWLPDGLCKRITMTPATIAPGENATFSAPFQVPANYTPGSYNESFKPLVETITWLHDIFLTVAINVISTPNFVVAKEIDDGSENTLSWAISQATNGQVISISPGITSIKIKGMLPTLSTGVQLVGGQCNSPVLIDGSDPNASVTGLILSNNNKIEGLRLQGFTGKQILVTGTGNSLMCVSINR